MGLARIQAMVPESVHRSFYSTLMEYRYRTGNNIKMQDFLAEIMSIGLEEFESKIQELVPQKEPEAAVSQSS